MDQPSLFHEPALGGLTQGDEIVTPEEERALIAGIDAAGLSPFRFHGWEGKRLTRSFGWRYDFDDASLSPAEPIPDWLLPLRDRAAQFAGLTPDDVVQASVIRYDPGATIGWHLDRPVFAHVLGISLGTTAVLRFRRRRGERFERARSMLPPRSIYHLNGEARHLWEHSIAALERTRWSITFRSLSERGRTTTALGGGEFEARV
jgi:alkylated DNA repair dioxygenase AlkB